MSDQAAADYWNQHLEYNALRMNSTSQGARDVAWFLEAAGDILRESTKPTYCDPGYVQEKINRLSTGAKHKVDWNGEMTPKEARDLKVIKSSIAKIPETSEKVSKIKHLIKAVADRDRFLVAGIVANLPPARRMCQ
jgi:hypothetical protein